MQDFFIRKMHDALSGHHSTSVAEAIQFSEQSRTKCIGITIETRPDYCLKPHLNEMLSYGCTRYTDYYVLLMHAWQSVCSHKT